MNYTTEQLVSVARREKNTSRGYLMVNPLQGKHVPVSPNEALALFTALAEEIKEIYKDERILYVGFAETATAIGASVAVTLGGYYLQTTREQVENVEFFDFSESHSHATEQKLSQTDLDYLLPNTNRIVFVEDEVSTGNTILNIINILKKHYKNPPKFSVLSILNGMNPEAMNKYKELEINLHYLLKTDHSTYEEIASKFSGNGSILEEKNLKVDDITPILCERTYQNTRRVVETSSYLQSCEELWEEMEKRITLPSDKNASILVLGTEEFMYPPLFVGKKLEDLGYTVKFHATTRSPIAVSEEENYPLQLRWNLPSVYQEERNTFLYNLATYQQVYIITDSTKYNDLGMKSLYHCLSQHNNQDITVVGWC